MLHEPNIHLVQNTIYVHYTNTSRLMPFTAVIVGYFYKHYKHIRMHCVPNAELPTFAAGGTYYR
jgi:hypothetical protein